LGEHFFLLCLVLFDREIHLVEGVGKPDVAALHVVEDGHLTVVDVPHHQQLEVRVAIFFKDNLLYHLLVINDRGRELQIALRLRVAKVNEVTMENNAVVFLLEGGVRHELQLSPL